MVAENLTSILPNEISNQISFLITLFQAIGGLIIFYIVFNVVNIILNRKKKKELQKIKRDLEEIKKILKNKK